MTTSYVPTVGELAHAALESFRALQADAEAGRSAGAGAHAADLVRAWLALLSKFPSGSRDDFASVLPLTRLELALMTTGGPGNEGAAEVLAGRLMEWATRSPVLVDEAPVHAADFLARIASHLDRWAEREEALTLAARMQQA